MADSRRPSTRIDEDGVRILRDAGGRGRAAVWATVAVVAALGAALLWWSTGRPGGDEDAPFRERRDARQPARSGAAAEEGVRVVKRPRRPPGVGEVPRREVGGEHRAARQAESGEAAALPETSDYGDGAVGIAAFPPPGTEPLKRGIVVPEDFDLPEGFVRHYQTTDDGKPLRAILMFHPDYQPVDGDGEPLAVPDDRVVPPEMAPPGLAIDVLDDPEPEIPYAEESDSR